MSTKIPYINEAWNVCTGCAGKGCKAKETCWARDMIKRFPAIHEPEQLEYPGLGIPFDRVQFHPDRLDKPLHWKKPRRIGVCFLGDLFDEQVPHEWRLRLFENMPSRHQYFFLTKQPQNLREFLQLCEDYDPSEWPNVWWGVSICDQEDWDTKYKDFLGIPGRKWISYEPALSRVWFGQNLYQYDWLVCGAESGPKRRPCDPQWMIDVVRQCKEAGVPVYVKAVSLNGKVTQDITKFPKELQLR